MSFLFAEMWKYSPVPFPHPHTHTHTFICQSSHMLATNVHRTAVQSVQFAKDTLPSPPRVPRQQTHSAWFSPLPLCVVCAVRVCGFPTQFIFAMAKMFYIFGYGIMRWNNSSMRWYVICEASHDNVPMTTLINLNRRTVPPQSQIDIVVWTRGLLHSFTLFFFLSWWFGPATTTAKIDSQSSYKHREISVAILRLLQMDMDIFHVDEPDCSC